MTSGNSTSAPCVPDLAALWAHGPGAAFRLQPDFRCLWMSDSAAALTGRSARDWIDNPAALESAVHPLDWTRHTLHRQSLPQHPQGASLSFRLLHAETGAVVWLREFCVPCYDAKRGVCGFEGTWVNDSPAAQLDKHRVASAWTETLTVMSAGLAHDFNNVLTGVISLSEHFLSQVTPGHPFHEGLTLLHQNGREASRWIHRFSQMQQTHPGQSTWHDVNELVAETAQLLRHTLSRRYGLEVCPAPQPEPLMIDAIAFQRALLMLVFRAVALMPRPTPLRICVAHEPPGAAQAKWVRVGIEVTGDPSTAARADHRDAALTAVRQFAAKHGGRLEVDPTAATGTTTCLILPGAAGEPSTPVQPQVDLHARRWLLLGGGNAVQCGKWADWLRAQSFLVSFAEADAAMLADDDYLLDAAILLPEAGAEAVAIKFLERVRATRRELPVLTILTKGVSFESELQFSQVTTVVSAGEAQRERLLNKLASLLPHRQCGGGSALGAL